jgi:hypothetical protein
MSRDAGIVFRNWSGARDLNPGPHGPELCDISFRNGGNDRFLLEFIGRRHGGVVIRPDLFAELLHELLQIWLAVNLSLPFPYLHMKEDPGEWSRRLTGETRLRPPEIQGRQPRRKSYWSSQRLGLPATYIDRGRTLCSNPRIPAKPINRRPQPNITAWSPLPGYPNRSFIF